MSLKKKLTIRGMYINESIAETRIAVADFSIENLVKVAITIVFPAIGAKDIICSA